MKCKEMHKYFDDYILGELDSVIEMQINEHLAECKMCRQILNDRETVINMIRNTQKFEPGAGTYDRIKSRIVIPKKEKRLFWIFPKSLIYVAASFVLGLILMRTVDIIALQRIKSPQVEMRYEPSHKEPFSDTVQFYSAPPKNLARI